MEEVYGRAERALKESLETMTIASMSSELEMRFLTNLKPPVLGVAGDAPQSGRSSRRGAANTQLPSKAALLPSKASLAKQGSRPLRVRSVG